MSESAVGGGGSEVSRGRRIAAGLSLASVGGYIAAQTLGSAGWFDGLILGFAGLLGVAGVGIAQRSLPIQVLSRATAWIVLLPALIASGVGLLMWHMPPLELMGAGAASLSALLLARPLLHTKEARAAFAPHTFRSTFLAGSTATATVGLVAGGAALSLAGSAAGYALATGIFSMMLLASSLAVVRMRAWGILLGTLTSVATLIVAMLVRGEIGFSLALAALPTLGLHLVPVLVARWAGTERSRQTRVAALEEPVHYRVAAMDSVDDLDVGEASAPAPAAARSMSVPV